MRAGDVVSQDVSNSDPQCKYILPARSFQIGSWKSQDYTGPPVHTAALYTDRVVVLVIAHTFSFCCCWSSKKKYIYIR